MRFTHPERVVFPEGGFTKERLARYYEKAAAAMLPHLADRPLTLVRCPEGVAGECFYVKHAGPWAPKALRRITIAEKTKTGEYLTVANLEGLIGLVQMGVVEIHTWNSRARSLEKPDRIVFDLDPGPGVEWRRVVAAAVAIRELLQSIDLASFVKTTGGKGLHIVAPLLPRAGWHECAEVARVLSAVLVRRSPDEFLTDMTKAKRPGRILLDHARNNRGSTSVAAYSTRARPAAPVSMPVAWSELDSVASGDAFHLEEAEQLLTAPRRSDPWPRFDATRQSMTAARLRAAAALGGGATR